jgi:hypothetical protein
MNDSKTHDHLHKKVIYSGHPCRIIAVTHSARECMGGLSYTLMPEGERCLSKSIQYVTSSLFEFVPEVNEVLQSVAAHRRLRLAGGIDAP